MTQKVIGLDLGSSQVKAVVVHMGLRGAEVLKYDLEAVELDATLGSTHVEIAQAAGRLIDRLNVTDASIFIAAPGDMVSIRSVKLPTSIGRRAEQVLRFELDEQIPYDIEDAVFDYLEVARTPEEISCLATVAPISRLGLILGALLAEHVEPREIAVAPWVLGEHVQRDPSSTVLVIDIGHVRTDVAIIGDGERTCRTILRGGRNFTERLAAAGEVSFAEAEVHKCREGLNGRVGEVLKEALKPLVRELLQTIAGHESSGGRPVTRALVCGGSSQLPGLCAFLSDALGFTVSRHSAVLPAGLSGSMDHPASGTLFVGASSLSRSEEIPKTRRFNLRKGPFAFKGDSEALQRKIIWIAACFTLIVLAWIFSTVTTYFAVSDDVERLETIVRAETKRVFGEEITNPETIAARLTPTADTRLPIPTKDAYDLVVELSTRIPESVVHDIDLLDIKPRKIKIRGEVNTTLNTEATEGDEEDLSPTDLIKQKLTEFSECFVSFRIPKVQNVGVRQKYDMEIDSKCP